MTDEAKTIANYEARIREARPDLVINELNEQMLETVSIMKTYRETVLYSPPLSSFGFQNFSNNKF